MDGPSFPGWMAEKVVTEFFDREEDEPMGVLTDENLMVTRVQGGTQAEGQNPARGHHAES